MSEHRDGGRAAPPAPHSRRAPARLRQPFEQLRREIDRFIQAVDQAFAAPSLESVFAAHWPQPAAAMVEPAVDILEKDGAYEVRAELPGLAAEEIEVTFASGVLRIKGEKREAKDARTKDYHLHERHFGAFERAFRLPEDVDGAAITAGFTNGVLTVVVPKSAHASAGARKIAITPG